MTSHKILRVAGLVIVISVLVAPVRCEEPPDHPPRIGLVLSGGGALGSAHVGVLKVLEELRIPVHCIAGTSMGSIVGGLYAAGISPDEMEQILADTDWRDLFDDRPPRRQLPLRRKVDDQTYLTQLEIGFNRGSFQLPPGLVTGQKLGFTLQTMALQSAGINDFDKLAIPFRAVATDIENGEMVVLGRGDLAHAMRASMSIPGVFAPVEIDGRLLIDGGLVRNLPVDVALDMGAEVIIAVDVGLPLLAKSELVSLSKVISQMIGSQMRRIVEEQAAQATVLIRPDLQGFSSSQFERSEEIVPYGEAAARQQIAALSAYSVSEEEYAAYLLRIRKRMPPPATVASVQLTVSSTADPVLVMSRLRIRPGDPFDPEVIRRELERLYETGDYERVEYYLSKVEDGYILHIDAYDKSWGPNYLRFGLSLVSDFQGSGSYDLLASYTMPHLNRLRGELKVSAQLGEHPQISGELYQPLSLSQTWFVAARLYQTTTSDLVPYGDQLYVSYRTDVSQGAFDLGLQLGKYGELRFGLVRGRSTSELRASRLGKQVLPAEEIEADFGGYHFVANIDQFDNMNFPRHGYFSYIDYYRASTSLGSESEYERLRVFTAAAATFRRHTLLGMVSLYSALGSDSPEITGLGGLFALSGSPPNSVVGRYGGNAALIYLYRLLDLPAVIGDGLYIGGSAEVGNLWQERDQVGLSDLHNAYSVVLGVDTLLGPVYLAHGFTRGGDSSLYLFVGRTF